MRSKRTLALALLVAGLAAAAPERGEPVARLSEADDALEYWDVLARFDQGQRVVARVLVTNEGPGERTAVGVGHLVLPDGEAIEFRNGRLEGRWSIAADRRSLRIGSTQLALAAGSRTLEYDNNKRGIEIRMRFHSDAPARFPNSGEDPAYRVDLLDLAVRVDATILLPGLSAPLALSGRGTLTHTWMDASESALVLRRIDFSSLDADAALYLREVRSPEGKVHRWMIVERGDEVLAERSDFDLAFESPPDAASGYPIPARLRISGSGVAGEIALGRTLVQHDPLGDLPQPFRFLLSFEMRPRRVWTDSPFSLRLEAESGRSATALEGNGITSVTYLNPIR